MTHNTLAIRNSSLTERIAARYVKVKKLPGCTSIRRGRPGWAEAEIYFRIVYVALDARNGGPVAAYREQTVEIALGPKGAFENGNILDQSLMLRNRKALLITDTELKVMAAPASMGLKRMPHNGYSAPAATGTPKAL